MTVRSKIGLTVTVTRKNGFAGSKGTDSQSKLVLLVVRVVTFLSKSVFTCSKGSDSLKESSPGSNAPGKSGPAGSEGSDRPSQIVLTSSEGSDF